MKKTSVVTAKALDLRHAKRLMISTGFVLFAAALLYLM